MQIRLPPFWPKNPGTCFSQAEPHFHLRRTTWQLAKYYNIAASLPMKMVDELGDFLAVPPTPGTAYDQLNTAILRRTTDSELSRLHQLLNTEERKGFVQ